MGVDATRGTGIDQHGHSSCCASARRPGWGSPFCQTPGFPEPEGPADRLVPVLPDEIGHGDGHSASSFLTALSEIPRIRAVLNEIRAFLHNPEVPTHGSG